MGKLSNKLTIIVRDGLFSRSWWKSFGDHLGMGKSAANEAVTDPDSLRQFIQTRSSYVAQTALYGYLCTRAGTRYPELFENPRFLEAINIAKWQLWLASLSDLAVYAGGLINQRCEAPSADIELLMASTVDAILDNTGVPEDAGPEYSSTAETVRQRIRDCNWSAVKDDESPFIKSPAALVYWAPIADELKRLDDEIVRNSVRFRWHEIRRAFRRKLQAEILMRSVSAAEHESA